MVDNINGPDIHFRENQVTNRNRNYIWYLIILGHKHKQNTACGPDPLIVFNTLNKCIEINKQINGKINSSLGEKMF